MSQDLVEGILAEYPHRLCSDAILIISPDQSILYANESARGILSLGQGPSLGGSRCSEALKLSLCGDLCPFLTSDSPECRFQSYFVKQEGRDAIFCVTTNVIRGEHGEVAGVVHSLRDMAAVRALFDEQESTKETLRLEKLRVSAILESIADGIFCVDENLTITHFSKSLEQITGYSQAEVLGQSCRSVFRGAACDAACPARLSLTDGQRVENFQTSIATKDGRTVPVFMTVSVMKEGGRAAGVACSVQDRTEIERLRRELAGLSRFPELVGKSKAMLDLFDFIDCLRNTNATVLIEGATGTGKELVARAVHDKSLYAKGPFVAVNCSALSPFLLESELFGHAKGAFTGAVRDQKGKFEVADGGTLFLDEVSEVSRDVQVKLLRFLQSREFERVGETLTRRADVRIVAASNRSLRELVEAGQFREDLFYRLDVIPVRVPSLKERKEDIPLLAEHFLKKHARVNQRVEGISLSAIRALLAYDWPGNVRELENAVMYAAAACPGNRIEPACLPPGLSKVRGREAGPAKTSGRACASQEDLLEVERRRILRALEASSWRVEEAARSLGYSRATLWRRFKRLGLKLPNRRELLAQAGSTLLLLWASSETICALRRLLLAA